MKKVLILCDVFPPQFAPRMGYLAKYIKNFGWTSFVLSAGLDISYYDKDFSFLEGFAEAKRIVFKEICGRNCTYKFNFAKKIDYFFCPDNSRPVGLNDKIFFEGSKILEGQNFDAILCSTHQLVPLGAAKRLSENYGIPWVADLRDVVDQIGKTDKISLREGLVIKRIKARRNYLLRNASSVISVSPWHVDLLSRINPNSYLIYNGYDPELFGVADPLVTSKFTVTYTGVANSVSRDLSLFFRALFTLLSENVISAKDFVVQFFSGRDSHVFVNKEAKKYGVEALVDCRPYVTANEIPSILHNSSLLLLLSNKSSPKGPNGVMTTKFFEYLGVGRPILLTRSDEACLEKALMEANAGKAARNVDDAYLFLKSKYFEWREKGFTTGTTDTDVIKKYSRREQAKEFASVLDRVI